jgi:hypothetical protein
MGSGKKNVPRNGRISMGSSWDFMALNVYIAIEHGHRNS